PREPRDVLEVPRRDALPARAVPAGGAGHGVGTGHDEAAAGVQRHAVRRERGDGARRGTGARQSRARRRPRRAVPTRDTEERAERPTGEEIGADLEQLVDRIARAEARSHRVPAAAVETRDTIRGDAADDRELPGRDEITVVDGERRDVAVRGGER